MAIGQPLAPPHCSWGEGTGSGCLLGGSPPLRYRGRGEGMGPGGRRRQQEVEVLVVDRSFIGTSARFLQKRGASLLYRSSVELIWFKGRPAGRGEVVELLCCIVVELLCCIGVQWNSFGLKVGLQIAVR